MIELLAMRHAKSDWSTGDSDFDRPLNERGVRAADRMARWLNENDLVPERVLSSPAARTRATTMAVVHCCGVDRGVVDFEDRLYWAGDAFTWLQALSSESARRILICGHNPAMDDLVDFLSGERVPLTSSGKLMTTAAVAHFEFDADWADLQRGSGRLVSLVRPRDLT